LPYYRKTKGILSGSYLNGNAQYSNVSIPVSHIIKSDLDNITSIEISDNISSIEHMLNQQGLKISVNSATKHYLENSIRALGNSYFQLYEIYLDLPALFMSNIIGSVRSKLLEFMLELEKRFGYESEIETFRSKTELVTQILNTTINTKGNGNLINAGDNNDNMTRITLNKSN